MFCPAKNLREFIAEVKAHKPAYQYASAGMARSITCSARCWTRQQVSRSITCRTSG